MNYFKTAAQRKATGGTCYFEFQKGKYRRKHWLDDSLCIHADVFDDLKLYDLFSAAIPDFEYYYFTAVTHDQWAQLISIAKEHGGQWQAVAEELAPWVEACFQKHKVFTICGI